MQVQTQKEFQVFDAVNNWFTAETTKGVEGSSEGEKYLVLMQF